MNRIRVAILTRDSFRSIGLREVLARDPQIAVLESPRGLEEPEDAVRELPDVVVLDGTTLTVELSAYLRACKRTSPHTNFLLIGTDAYDDVVGVFRAGVKGYLNILSYPDEIGAAVKAIHQGHAWIARRTMGRLIDEVAFEPSRGEKTKSRTLPTQTEQRVLELLAREGLTNKEIAAQLRIEERTVEFHLSSLLHKFLLSNRNQLIIYAIRRGLVRLGSPLPCAPASGSASPR